MSDFLWTIRRVKHGAVYHQTWRNKNPRWSGGVRSDSAYAITSSYSRSIVHSSFVMPACIAGVSR